MRIEYDPSVEAELNVTPTTRPKRYTWRDWNNDHAGQIALRVSLGYWRELKTWPVPGRVFQWHGWIPELWYYVKCRLWRRYHVLTIRTLPPTWQDTDTKMLHAMFHLLGDVIFKERIFEHNGYDDADDATDGKSWKWALTEMQALWQWWTVERPAREAEYDRRLTVWSALRRRDQQAHRAAHPDAYEPRVIGADVFGKAEKVYPWPAPERAADTDAAWTALNEMDESVRDAEDDAMLIRLIKVRRYLWT